MSGNDEEWQRTMEGIGRLRLRNLLQPPKPCPNCPPQAEPDPDLHAEP